MARASDSFARLCCYSAVTWSPSVCSACTTCTVYPVSGLEAVHVRVGESLPGRQADAREPQALRVLVGPQPQRTLPLRRQLHLGTGAHRPLF